MSGFTHLHCHSEYSLLDGAIRLKDLCARAVDFGFSSAAVTDHGNLFGSLPFYLEAKKHSNFDIENIRKTKMTGRQKILASTQIGRASCRERV